MTYDPDKAEVSIGGISIGSFAKSEFIVVEPDPAHQPQALVDALAEAERIWPGPRYDLEIDDDLDRAAAQGRRNRYRLRVWRSRPNGTRRRQHAIGYGPTPQLAVANVQRWDTIRRRQKARRS